MCARGRVVGGRVSRWSSSGLPSRTRFTAQALNAGIRECGSSTGLVSALAADAPPQWKGTKTVSARMSSLTLARNVAAPRRVVSCDDVAVLDAEPPGEIGVQLRLGLRLRWDGAGTRRVCVPLWYCASSRPVVSKYG